jgi:hypothetical protein
MTLNFKRACFNRIFVSNQIFLKLNQRMNLLRSFLACFSLALLWNAPETLHGQCMMVPVSLEARVQNADAIVEARVTGKQGFWDDDHSRIYTAYTLSVSRSFKGGPAAQLQLVAPGGRVGMDLQVVEPSLQLEVGQMGVFLLSREYSLLQASAPHVYQAFAGPQGFIALQETGEGHDPFASYTDAYAQVFESIMQHTQASYQVVNLQQPHLWVPGEKRPDQGDGLKPLGTNAVPNITSFSPTTTTAGTGSVLTITGSNFGTYSAANSAISFRDANSSSAFVDAFASDIVSWTDTEIKVLVRTNAGTGAIRVRNVDGTATSTANLTVLYNLTGVNSTQTVPAGKFFQPELTGPNGTGGYTFQYSTNFAANADAVASFERALQSWRCATGVNFTMAAGTTTITCNSGLDAVNVVSFDTDCQLPSGVLGINASNYAGCINNGQEYWFVRGHDLIFRTPNNPTVWEFGPALPATNETDFETVALHELGHTHQLGHVINNQFVMHFSLGNGVAKRSLNATSDLAGANAVLSWSDNQNSVTRCVPAPAAHTRLYPTDCAPPRIRFANALQPQSLNEGGANMNAATGDCRRYRDYPITMQITGSPTGNATVTFDAAGSTATPDADYALYNAAATAPITSLVFPAGSNASQAFTLRLYDDRAVEAQSRLRLNFSISGTTNALKGSGRDTTLIVNFVDNDLLPANTVPLPTVNDDLTTATVYIGPSDTVVVYDDGGELIGVLANLSQHNYGCTTVEVDRAGTGAVAFQRTPTGTLATQKTLLITPTNSNPGGSFLLTAYFTEAEIAGWETATGGSRANLTLFRSGGKIGNVSPTSPTPAGNPSSSNRYGTSPVSANFGGAGVAHALAAQFPAGLGGFAAGLGSPNGPILTIEVPQLTLSGSRQGTSASFQLQATPAGVGGTLRLERSLTSDFAALTEVQSQAYATSLTFADAEAPFSVVYYRARWQSTGGDVVYSAVVQLAALSPELTLTGSRQGATAAFQLQATPAGVSGTLRLERSLTSDFAALTEVQSQAYATSLTFTDSQAPTTAAYYRVRWQGASAGQTALSNVVQLQAVTPTSIVRSVGQDTPPFQLYPNPSHDRQPTLAYQDMAAFSISVHNSLGQLVAQYARAAGSGLVQLDLRQQPAGVYTVSLSTASQQWHSRFVLQ